MIGDDETEGSRHRETGAERLESKELTVNV